MFVYYIVLALILTQVPIIGKYFKLFNTLIHEIGHILATILTGGHVGHMTLSPDTSGGANTGSRNFITRSIVTLSGYPFASGISLLLIYAVHQEQHDYILYGMIAIILISLIFWIRNIFGYVWLGLAGLITAGFIFVDDPLIIKAYATIITAVVFVDSFMSTLELFKIIIKDKEDAGDAHNLKNSTGITEYFWGILFIAIACIPVYYSFDLWF